MTAKTFFVLVLLLSACVLSLIATFAFGDFIIHGWADSTDHALFAAGFFCFVLAVFIEHFPARGTP
jgi:ABC-type proline/glycine betaine transport system permease subunit